MRMRKLKNTAAYVRLCVSALKRKGQKASFRHGLSDVCSTKPPQPHNPIMPIIKLILSTRTVLTREIHVYLWVKGGDEGS